MFHQKFLKVYQGSLYHLIILLKIPIIRIICSVCKFSVYKLDGVPEEAPNFEKLLYFSEEEAYLINSLIGRLSPTNSLKKGLKDKLAIIYDSTNIEDFVDRRSNAAHVENLRKAAEEKKQVILHDYESASSDSVCDRRIEPFGFTTDFIEVWGYDLEAQKNKV